MAESSLIAVHPRFGGTWPFAAGRLHEIWKSEGEVEFRALEVGDDRTLGELSDNPERVRRAVCLDVPFTAACLERLSNLREAAFLRAYDPMEIPTRCKRILEAREIELYSQTSEGFWGQSVAEFALALTLCGLRRIPQLHCEILSSLEPWDYEPRFADDGTPVRAPQYGDNPDFARGTLAGKRVRIVGIGNIGSRYAQFVTGLGAEAAAWDPFANEPSFHRSGARRVWRLDELVQDAEVFAPMLPLDEKTEGLVTASLVDALPMGTLVVLVTRAGICDMEAVRRRVLANALALAADVFDREPLPLSDPLLGRANVIHTPHIAGRTKEANFAWAEALAERFRRKPSWGVAPG